MPARGPPAGESAVQNLRYRAKRRGIHPQLPAGRTDTLQEHVLSEVVQGEHGGDGTVHARQAEQLPVGEEKPGMQVSQVSGEVVGVIWAQDEVWVLHHEGGEEV